MQLYFDFAGYSEMSNGLSLMMGFECPANFNLPYISGSITEFWRRWHISLSGWFRDSIYTPLGGNRCSAGRQMLNMLAVWALTGIWHGANWNFICWGLYYFVLLVIEKNFLMKYLKKGKVWPHIYTLFLVVLGWGLFTCNAPGAPLGLLLSRLFIPQGGVSALYFLRNYAVLLVVCPPTAGAVLAVVQRQSPATGSALRRLLCSVHGVCGSSNGFHRTVCKLLRGGMALWKNMFTADPTVICRQLP